MRTRCVVVDRRKPRNRTLMMMRVVRIVMMRDAALLRIRLSAYMRGDALDRIDHACFELAISKMFAQGRSNIRPCFGRAPSMYAFVADDVKFSFVVKDKE